jgi:GTP-binding protein EngB required for normal cell division
MDLKQYEDKKFLLAEMLRSAAAIDTRDSDFQGKSRELLTRLAEDQFNLMVVGRFSRGKSTLMNAILGGDHLPTGIVPLTSVITTVRYGSRTQAVLHFREYGLNREIPLSQLADYVTQKGNPGNAKRIAWAEIQLPVEILRRGFFFVDTPGLGSPIIENTLTTERFLPEADAFILVTSYESPLSDEEDRILERIRITDKKLYVVINKQDTVTPEEREQAQQFISERLAIKLGWTPEHIFSISARQGLEARIAGNKQKLEESGLREFESELLRFLTEDRTLSFLRNTYDRVMNLLLDASRSDGNPDHEPAWNSVTERLRGEREAITGIAQQPEHLAGMTTDSSAEAMKLDIDRKSGCHVCGAVVEAVFRFLSKYQYELTINPETQHEHARREGFCPLHTWQYEGISSPYGVCTAYPQLVHRVAAGLEEIADAGGDPTGKLRALLPTPRSCPACEVRIQAEQTAMAHVAELTRQAEGRTARIPACCLPHLAMVVERLGLGEPARKLLEAHALLLERTAEDLQRYALKHDALRRYLTSQEERSASQIALLLLAGHRSVSSPWTIEYIL